MRRALLSLAVAAGARAAGIDTPDQGAQAMARGGAFAAKADDPSAIYYNPAGLAKLRGWNLLFDSAIRDERLTFRRVDVDDAGNVARVFPEVRNSDAPFWQPLMAVTYDFGLRNATFAAGLYGPSANRYRSWPTCGPGVEEQDTLDYCGDENDDSRYAPQRYLALRQDLFVAFPTVGGAWRALPWLDLGAEFQATYNFVRVEQAMNSATGSLPVGDNHVFLGGKDGGKLTDPFTPAFMAGALVRPPLRVPRGHGIEVGLSWRSPFTLRPEGDIDIDLSDTYTGARYCLVDPDLGACPEPGEEPVQPHGRLVMPLPWILRGGVRWFYARDGFEVWDVEIDGTFEPYSTVDSIDLEFDPPLQIFPGGIAIDVIPQPRHWGDTGSVRLGGGYSFRRAGPGSLHLRAGGNYEGGAAPLEYTQLDFSPFRRFGAAGGVGYTWRGVTLSATYMRLWSATRTVTASEVRTINTLNLAACDPKKLAPGDPNPCDAVGNGTFTAAHNLIGVGLDVAFDDLLR